MIIQSQDVQLESSKSVVKRYEKNETLDAWDGNNRLHISSMDGKKEISDFLDLSPNRMAKLIESAAPEFPKQDPLVESANAASMGDDEDANLPLTLRLAKKLLEIIFGVKITVIDPSKSQQNTQRQSTNVQGWGIRYDYHEVNYEKEMVKFSASGEVTTEDGRKITFDAKMEMSKEKLQEVTIRFRAGDTLIDPLAMNFDGNGVQLTTEKYQFDLNNDGKSENLSFLQEGSGFLALDKNNNGTVDNGSELFGLQNNQGFLELKAYDQDQNNWIDEKDPVFSQLKIWTKNINGADTLSSLNEYNVGAIYLDSSNTLFDLEGGKLRESGIYLKETGETGYIQEVDVRV